MKISKHLLFSILTCLYVYSQVTLSDNQNIPATVDVGLILDLNTTVGEMTKTCIVMAIEDFYASHSYKTRIKLHIRDSKGEAVEAASAAIDLLKNVQVKSILGPIHSTQADFVADIGNKSQVPILSFSATSPSLSHTETPYFIRIARNDISQVKAIAAIIKAFGWREIVPIYEDTNYGRGIISYLTDALQEAGARVSQQTVISPLARDDQIFQQLYKLMTKQTRVFVVHMSPSFASRIFSKAKEAGMMSKGYVWIVTDGIATMLNSKEASSGTDLMQGVIGVKPFIPNTQKLENFNERWKQRFHLENPGMEEVELNAFGVWAYDSIYALALAIERVGASMLAFRKPDVQENLTDLTEIGTFQTGPKLLESILNTRFSGLSGEFEIIDGQIQSSTYNIVNVVGENEKEIGLWSPTDVFSKDSLADVEWPGRSIVVPKGWEIPTSEKKLKIGVPLKSGFNEFIKVERDPHTRAPMVTGFCVDVFNAVLNILPYNVPYEFIPFETYEGSGQSAGNYDDLVRKVYDQTFDAVVGDITIVKNRLEYADFTLPFTESGVSLIVPFKDDEKRNAWIFMKPLTADLWITTGVLFLYTGFVVWVLEHRVNTQFRGSRIQQLGIIFWFSFSTLVFAHRETLVSNLSRFVVIVWVFVVLVLTSSYTASLTSMLTVQKLKPNITNIEDIVRNGEYVGYQKDSFVPGILKRLKVNESRMKEYRNFTEYDEALSKGSRNGGVAAIMDEMPYLRSFLAKNCKKYSIIGPTYKTAGLGFGFPIGSPLVADISRAILSVTEGDQMSEITSKWLGNQDNCAEDESTKVTSNSLSLDRFKGLFIIAGASSSSALIIFMFTFLLENRYILTSKDSVQQKLSAIAKNFDEKKEVSSHASKKETSSNSETTMDPVNDVPNVIVIDAPQSPAVSLPYHDEGIFSQDERGFSSTEPGTPTPYYYRSTSTGNTNIFIERF